MMMSASIKQKTTQLYTVYLTVIITLRLHSQPVKLRSFVMAERFETCWFLVSMRITNTTWANDKENVVETASSIT